MSVPNDGGPAFPSQPVWHLPGGDTIVAEQGGMTLRQYAAIKLRVPNSGIGWLDDMIRTAQRDEAATQAMAGALGGTPGPHLSPARLAAESYAHADAMLKAREVKP